MHLALFDLQVQMIEGGEPTEGLHQALDADRPIHDTTVILSGRFVRHGSKVVRLAAGGLPVGRGPADPRPGRIS
ncbi:hypothetical protein GCM10009841_01920 [Microlunatus panaciterrae]